jgi:hypothetical protein
VNRAVSPQLRATSLVKNQSLQTCLFNNVLAWENSDKAFHISRMSDNVITITSARQLSMAIENYAALWDLLFDKTNNVHIVWPVMADWVNRLNRNAPQHIADLSITLLVRFFMENLFDMVVMSKL